MEVGLGLGKCVNVARGEDSLSSACKNYKGSNFLLGGLLILMQGGLDKRWHLGFGREQGWCWFQHGVVWTKGGTLVLGESRIGVDFSVG